MLQSQNRCVNSGVLLCQRASYLTQITSYLTQITPSPFPLSPYLFFFFFHLELTMELLSLSAPVSVKLRTNSFSFRPQISPSSYSIIKCSSSLNNFPQITASSKTLGNGGLGFNLVPPPSAVVSASTAMRGPPETGDPMGLLLRERIVFVPSEIDDFSADSVISQLLLLDAQNPNKDIRVFVNSVGGSMRYIIFTIT